MPRRGRRKGPPCERCGFWTKRLYEKVRNRYRPVNRLWRCPRCGWIADEKPQVWRE
ncbi:MAG TPA: hypothetical protein VJN63_05610 [Thermoplasmata archaeon]|nr:hypothetical protein [Thermoplasmata archaeon]